MSKMKSILSLPLLLLGWLLLWFVKFASGRLTVVTICGIPLKISGAFILFLVFLGGFEYMTSPADVALEKAQFIVAIISIAYLCVIPHEYGHALVAKKLGYKAIDITLWPYAGLASIDGDWYKHPRHEILIALAGPGVNFFLGSIFIWFVQPELSIVGFFFVFNFLLGCFNLLPLYPMDGGRIVRAFCVMNRGGDILKGNQDVQTITLIAACVFCPLAWFFWSPVVAVILLFVVLVGRTELQGVRARVFEEMAKDRTPFAKEDEILSAYKKKAEELPESEQENYLQKMERFHRWMTEAFTVNAQLAAKEFDDKEVALKMIADRWHNCIEFLCSLDEKRWWDFYGEFIDIDSQAIRTIAIERFLKGICYAPRL